MSARGDYDSKVKQRFTSLYRASSSCGGIEKKGCQNKLEHFLNLPGSNMFIWSICDVPQGIKIIEIILLLSSATQNREVCLKTGRTGKPTHGELNLGEWTFSGLPFLEKHIFKGLLCELVCVRCCCCCFLEECRWSENNSCTASPLQSLGKCEKTNGKRNKSDHVTR